MMKRRAFAFVSSFILHNSSLLRGANMSVEITMPQLSDTMEEGTVVKWLKKEGDKVKSGEVIAEVETDKATMEMESFESGTIEKIVVKEGEKAQVGKPIALLSGKSGGDSKPAPKQAEPAQAKAA